jgi:hypothetical protein
VAVSKIKAWSTQASPVSFALYGVFGSGPSNAWAAGAQGTLLRWTGTAWILSNSGVSDALWTGVAFGPNEAYVPGNGGKVLKWNGTAWSPMTTNTAESLLALRGVASNDL